MSAETQTLLVPQSITDAISNRKAQVGHIKNEIEQFNLKFTNIAKNNAEILIYSLLLEEVYVFVRSSAVKPLFFNIINFDVSKLNLLEIKIVFIEFFKDSYHCDHKIKFVFNDEQCQLDRCMFSLTNLKFDDQNLIFIDDSNGHYLNPKFENAKDYVLIKDTVLKIKQELGL